MNRDWHAKLSTAFPNRIEFRIVNLDQPARAIAKIKPQPLVFLEAGRAEPVPLLDLSDCALWEIRLVPPGVIQIHVRNESSCKKLVGQLLVASELGRPIPLVRGRSSAQ